MKKVKKIAIIGGGPSGMTVASFLKDGPYDIKLFEAKSTLGRKFLVAGKGGFNLTHHEPIDVFASRYHDNAKFFKTLLDQFSPDDLRTWLATLGIETFVGTSNRVFPIKGIKPAYVLKQMVNQIESQGVTIKTNHRLTHFTSESLDFETDEGNQSYQVDIIIFTLGGANWSKTGSDGQWKPLFESKGVSVKDFEASNCGLYVNWSEDILTKHEGKPLKNIALSSNGASIKGEIVITSTGIEGSPVYALTPYLREELKLGKTFVYLDLKPNLSVETIFAKLDASTSSISNTLKSKLKLSKTAFAIAKQYIGKDDFMDIKKLSKILKAIPIPIHGMAPLDEAISTAGGIMMSEINADLSLKKYPNVFIAGEMLDWEAPTGGYLLQGCFSMGYLVACGVKNKYKNQFDN